MKYYPFALNLRRRPVLVVGGGKVAERKTAALIASGAKVRLVSPRCVPGLRRLARENAISWEKREVRASDLETAALVVSATDSRRINAAVSRWGRRRGVWVNVVDNAALSDFISPAVLRASTAIVAVYTDGRSPKLSRDLKNFLKEHWHDFLSYRRRL